MPITHILAESAASLGGYATASLATRLDSAFARRSVIVIGLLLSVVMLYRFGKG